MAGNFYVYLRLGKYYDVGAGYSSPPELVILGAVQNVQSYLNGRNPGNILIYKTKTTWWGNNDFQYVYDSLCKTFTYFNGSSCNCTHCNYNITDGNGVHDFGYVYPIFAEIEVDNDVWMDYVNRLMGKRFTCDIINPDTNYCFGHIDFVFPTIGSAGTRLSVLNNVSFYECDPNVPSLYNLKQDFASALSSHPFVGCCSLSSLPFLMFSNRQITEVSSECDDERSSASTQECLITINGEHLDGSAFTQTYNLLFQPDSNHTSGCLTNIPPALNGIRKITGVTCRFINGVVRGVGVITIKGRLSGVVKDYIDTDPLPVPILVPVDEEIVLLSADFNACCDSPSSWAETFSETFEEVVGDSNVFSMQIEVIEICWNGFELLTNYCCDGVVCGDVEIEYPDDDTISDGGGDDGGGDDGGGDGGNVDITCICDNLEILNSKLDSLISAVSGLSLVCSPTINPSTVTPEITVTPCQPSITVLPCQPTVSVEGTDLTGLIDEIHSCFFKSVGDDCEKSITDYIQELVEKDCAPFIDVTISPYDLVNIRRVFRDTDE